MADLNTLRNWFRNGLKPTQDHFWAWMDSYWHKDEQIPLDRVDRVNELLASKAEIEAFEGHLKDEHAHGLSQKLDSKLDNINFQHHLEDENAHNLIEKLEKKVDLVQFGAHLDDEDPHELTEKLATKTNVVAFEEHVNDRDAHGINSKLETKADLDYVKEEIVRLEETFKSVILVAKNDKTYRLEVENDGTLVTVQL